MWRKAKHIELPRRLAAYYLLFGILAVLWVGCGLLWGAQTLLATHLENTSLVRMRKAATAISLYQLRNQSDHFQKIVDRLQAEQPFGYCALVDADGHLLAHSNADQQIKAFRPAVGSRSHVGDVARTTFATADGQRWCEYALVLKGTSGPWGTLYCATTSPSLWGTAAITGRRASAATLGASLFVALGALVVYRAVRPMAEIDRQLRQVATAAVVSDVPLYPVEAHSGAELGWNRLVDTGFGRLQQTTLHERVTQAIAGLGQQRWDDILNSLTEGLVVTDAENRIEFANRAAVALLSRDDQRELQGELIEQCLGLLTSGATDHPLLDPEAVSRVVSGDLLLPPPRSTTLRLQRSPIYASSSRVLSGYVWLLRDVTQLKLAEKMRDDFLNAATHELRTPLANIKAYTETLSLSEMIDLEQQKAFCNTINTEATRLARVVEDLLNISSMEAGSLTLSLQEVDLERLLQETVAKTKPSMVQKNITFEMQLPEKLPKLKLDKDKFAVALVNLLGNAAKYTPAGGRVKLQVQLTSDRLRIEVHDSGVGISGEDLPKVFEKFFRSKDQRVQKEAGTGLGLSFTQEVVRLHGGSMDVRSELNKGSTFTIQMPL